jgi:hypothetical protein
VTYSGGCRGTYVCAIAIDRGENENGPRGTFLSRNELLDVVSRLRQYVVAYRLLKPHGEDSQETDESHKDIDSQDSQVVEAGPADQVSLVGEVSQDDRGTQASPGSLDNQVIHVQNSQNSSEQTSSSQTSSGHISSDDDSQIMRAADFAETVDTQFGSSAKQGTRFIEHDKACRTVQFLINQLERRMDPALDPPQIQSPLMVGCTRTTMKKRTAQHRPQSSLHQTTNTWALMLSVLQHCGYAPIVQAVPVIANPHTEGFKLCERLVTALARSMVTQDGFNVTGAGGAGDTADAIEVETQRRYVLGELPIFRDNLERTVQRIRRLPPMLTTAGCLQTAHGVVSNEHLLNKLTSEITRLDEAVQAYRTQHAVASQTVSDATRAASETQARFQSYSDVLELLIAGAKQMRRADGPSE